jgi:hypothetical protein
MWRLDGRLREQARSHICEHHKSPVGASLLAKGAVSFTASVI